MSEIQGIPPPDSSPEKAIPIPTPPTPKIPSIPTLKSWLPLYFHKADTTLLHLSRLLSTPTGTDKLLLLISYASLTTSTLLTTASLHRFQSTLSNLTKAVTSLPPNTTLLIPSSSLPSPILFNLAKSLKALSSLISDFRIFVRLWGLLDIYLWGRGLYLEPPVDKVEKRIAWAQVLVNIGFQYLENGAYLAGKGVLGWDAGKQERAWLWSSRFWAAHVGLELWRLGYLKRKAKNGEGDGEVEGWWKQVVVNLAYAPMTVHWSLDGGLLSDLGVGALGSVVGVIGVKKMWEATA